MPAPIIGRKLGLEAVVPIEKEKAKGIKVLGISGSARREAGLSKSERLLISALDIAEKCGAITDLIKLNDLKIYECEGNYSENPSYCTYPCQSSLRYPDDEMQKVYTAIIETDVLLLSTPIRWNNHSALVQKFVERMNAIENSHIWFGNNLIEKKVVALIVIGHVDGLQHVAGNLFNFFSWLGFQTPDVAITSWVGEYDEDTTSDWQKIQSNKYTQEDLHNMVYSSLNLAYQLKTSCET
jgi:multimeric flavodoxin WrbA